VRRPADGPSSQWSCCRAHDASLFCGKALPCGAAAVEGATAGLGGPAGRRLSGTSRYSAFAHVLRPFDQVKEGGGVLTLQAAQSNMSL
jgi:hypothetical protein